jgi:hypothetical protein
MAVEWMRLRLRLGRQGEAVPTNRSSAMLQWQATEVAPLLPPRKPFPPLRQRVLLPLLLADVLGARS